MALQDQALLRYSIQYILNLTNPDKAAAQTNDVVRLAAICTDAQAELQLMTGVQYTDADLDLVRIGVEGVILVAKERKSTRSKDAREARKDFLMKCEEYRKRIGSEARIDPASSGVVHPSPEQVNVPTPRPLFDMPNFTDAVPNSPPNYSPDNPV